jgi:osmoprotectant transport system permease protein
VGAAAARTPPVLRGSWRVVATPLVLAAVVGALALYLGSRELDSIERRSLDLEIIVTALLAHVQLTAISSALVIAIAIPLGIMLTRPVARRAAPAVLGLANIGQAVPSIGVLALFAVLVGLGRTGVIVALVLYSFLSVLRNTMVGLEGIDPAVIDAARGMGLSKLQTLRRIELPLAVPVMLAGVRTALILNVGTATLATFTLGAPPDGSGGLGELINSGLRLGRLDTVVLAGAVLTAVLALLIDWAAGLVEDTLRPRGV